MIGVLHPGEMGAAVAAALRSAGHDVVWASEGRGPATAAARFVDGGIIGPRPRSPGTTRLYLSDACVRAGRSAATKGWRWVGEMDEIAATYAAAGLPAGFHRAAAEVFGRAPREEAADGDEVLEAVLGALTANAPRGSTDSTR